jgi:hypothetical protein
MSSGPRGEERIRASANQPSPWTLPNRFASYNARAICPRKSREGCDWNALLQLWICNRRRTRGLIQISTVGTVR